MTAVPPRRPDAGRPRDTDPRSRAVRRDRRFSDELAAARRQMPAADVERGTPASPGRTPPRPGARPALPRAEAAPDPAAPPAAPLTSPVPLGALASADPTPPLRAAVRAQPAAVESARAGDARLTLDLGAGALRVDLRADAAGIALTLRPAAPHERAAAAELPALVSALQARGVRVARAEVRGRHPGRGPTGRRAR
jgi:hypothetical protein